MLGYYFLISFILYEVQDSQYAGGGTFSTSSGQLGRKSLFLSSLFVHRLASKCTFTEIEVIALIVK